MESQIIIFALGNLAVAMMCDGMRGEQNVGNQQKATIEQSKMMPFVSFSSSSPFFLKINFPVIIIIG